MSAADHPSERSTKNLRERAERRISPATTDGSLISGEEMERTVYELQVHQEELNIQNEELRHAHIELQASRDRYADLYDFAPVGYLTVDATGQIHESNLTLATMLGVDRSKLIGSRLALYCDVGSRRDLTAHFEAALSSNTNHSRKIMFRTLDGAELCAKLDSQSVAKSSDTPRIRVVLTDISEQHKAEAALSEKDKHLRSLVDALPVLIGYLDANLRFRFVNAAHLDWFGQPPEALNGKRMKDVLCKDFGQEVEVYFVDVLSGRRINFESQLRHQHHGQRHVEMMLVPDTSPDGKVKGVHTLCIDITERKVVEEQNARRRRFSERLNRLGSDERIVYDLLVRGLANKAIAFDLDVGLRTVERRRQNIFDKLEVESLADLLQQLADIQGIATV